VGAGSDNVFGRATLILALLLCFEFLGFRLAKAGDAALSNVPVEIPTATVSKSSNTRHALTLSSPAASLPICGTVYAPPFASPSDAGPRPCPKVGVRTYTPRNQGIGFEILRLESEACFVQDDAVRLLDEIVNSVKTRTSALTKSDDRETRIQQALAVSRFTSEALSANGFGLYLPTETLGDALVLRNSVGESPRHIFDCDTGSMILLTVADALKMPASLVELTLRSGNQHNYVRWHIDRQTYVDWDMDAQAQCITPGHLHGYQGKALSRKQTISYVLTLRAELWENQKMFVRAIEDYRKAIAEFPARPGGYNGLAWLVASNEFPNRHVYTQEALAAARKAVALRQSPDYWDTLACINAYSRNFTGAVRAEHEALDLSEAGVQYLRHLERFKSKTDCTESE
jgi:tetratricopeptide (TPR) repeat protein